MKHTVFKRLLSALLSLAMVLSVVAMPVMAEEADAVIYYDNSASLWAQVFVSWADADGSEVAEIFAGDGDGLYEALIPGGSSLVSFGPSAEIHEHPLWLTSVTAGEVYRYAPPAEEPEEEPIEESVEEEPVEEEPVEEEPVEEEPVHEHDYVSTVTDPTCTEQGFTTYTCICGERFVESFTDALGHDLGDWVTDREATCTEDGSRHRTCSRCDYTGTETIPATGHSHSAVLTDPTCTEQGYTTYTCACGDSYADDYTDALGHDYVDGVCSVCGEAEAAVQAEEDLLASGTCGSSLTWTLSTDGVLTISGQGSMPNNGSSSAYGWNPYYASVTAVVIESGVTSIGDHAFEGCYNMTSITIPEGVASIGTYAFSGCEKLAGITLPAGVTGIGDFAFWYCESLAYITLPGSLSSIGEGAFFGCRSLTNISIPAGVTAIADHTFNDCQNLTGVTLPDSLTDIGDHAFFCCYQLTDITIPAGVTGIGDHAFEQCFALTSVNIPNGVSGIGEQAFYSCRSLTTVTIPSGVTGVGAKAFYGCSNLTTVTIPATVTSIGADAFYACSSIEDVFYGGTSDQWSSLSNTPSATFVHYSCAGWETVTTAPTCTEAGSSKEVCACGYERNAAELEAAGHKYADGVCSVCGAVELIASGTCGTDLTWELDANGVLTISGSGPMTAYSSYSAVPWNSYCTQITAVTVDNGVTSISGNAFNSCYNLTGITIGDDVTSIGAYAFYNCEKLTSITLPAGVASIEEFAFQDCESLNSITLPNSIRSIGLGAFFGCRSLTEISIPAGVTVIEDYTFTDCQSLTSVIIPDSVTSIGSHAFFGCYELTELSIPANVTSIGERAFDQCFNLASINIPSGVAVIEAYTFSDCRSLTSITIPATVTSISSDAFYGCNSIIDVFYGGIADQWAALSNTPSATYIHYSCTGWETVTTAPTCTEAGSSKEVCACGYERNATELEAAGHKYADGVCSVCGAVELIASGSCGSSLTWELDAKGVLTVSGNGPMEDYDAADDTPWYSRRAKITSVVIRNGITRIGDNAFRNLSSLISVTIPGSVSSIGSYAFSYCTGLTSITLPDGVTSIEGAAFTSCSNLTSITIPDSVSYIGGYTFCDCFSLTNVVIPENVTRIEDSTFNSCSNLTGITIPDGVTSIGGAAFAGCSGLTSIIIPDSVSSIGQSAFTGCYGLKSISLPDIVTIIESYAFNNCSSLTTAFYKGTETQKDDISILDNNGYLTSATWHYEVTEETHDGQLCYRCGKCGLLYTADGGLIPEGPTWTLENGVLTISGNGPMENYAADTDVPWYSQRTSVTSVVIGEGITSIGDRAFLGCNLQNITLPDSVTSIGAYAFFSCIFLRSITLPDGVTSIGDHAFYGCTSLADISMPDSVTDIGDYAFSGCPGLTAVSIPASVTSISRGLFWICTGLTTIIIPEGVTSIGSDAFQGCSNLDTVSIPDSVTSIGISAFSGCSSLSGITIPDGVTSIDSSTFSGCSSLSSITIPDGVTGIGSYAFQGCSSLKSITIPDSVTSIGSYAFQGCCSLTGVTLGNGVARIGSDAFLECTSLIDVYITDMAAWLNISFAGSNSHPFSALIEPHTLYLNGEAITALMIPDGVTAIPDHAFNGCAGITNVTIPDSVTVIGEYAFYDCSGITGIHIPESVTSIRFAAFEGCSGLKYINIPNAITEIDEWVFANCKGLTSITIPDSVTSIGDHAFRGCSMTSIIIPENITSIGYAAFEGCYSLTSVTIPHGITEIGEWVFGTCPKLASVTIPDSVTSIGENAFTGCNSIEDVFYGGTADQWSSLSNSPTATYVHYSCMSGEGHWETVVNAPTCTEDGSSRDVCACGYERNIEVTGPANGVHSFEDGVCSVCGESAPSALQAPTLSVSNVASTGKIKLTWNAVPGAVKYDVYRSTGKNGTYTLLKTATSTQLTNTSVTVGTTYYYYVVAVAENGAISEKSNTVSRTCDLARPTVTVTNVASSGKPKVSWNAVTGATKYTLYIYDADGTLLKSTTTTGTALTHSSATVGTAYTYKVKALCDVSAATSAFSASKSCTCALARPTVTVTNVASSGKIKISWNAVSGATKYTLYTYDDEGTLLKSTTTTGTSLTHSSAAAGTTYTYEVRALCGVSAATSAFSEAKTRTCDLARPTVTVSNVAASGKIKISWAKVTGATKYTLYIYDAEGSLLKTSTTTGTALTHSSAAAGTAYTYKVKALCSVSAATSAFSEAKTRVCDLPRPNVSVALNSNGKPVLTWAKISGAAKYTVYIYDADGTLLKTSSTTGTKLTHASAAAGTAYSYRVVAVSSISGANSAMSAAVSAQAK